MKKWVKKTLILMAAVVLVAGTASMVAYAHSGHHSQPGKAYDYCAEGGHRCHH